MRAEACPACGTERPLTLRCCGGQAVVGGREFGCAPLSQPEHVHCFCRRCGNSWLRVPAGGQAADE